MRVSKEVMERLQNMAYDNVKKSLKQKVKLESGYSAYQYKQNKYKNKKVVYDGIKFDSIKEKRAYTMYKLMEKSGEIKDLQRQVEYLLIEPFVLNGKKYRKTSYIADFVYKDKENKMHVIDVKSEATKTQVYKLKKKLMAWKYEIEIEEI